MEYHVDRFYIYIYVQREDSQWKDQTGLETDAGETRGDKHRSRRRKEREGEGQRWREIKTEREEWRPSANYLRFPATGAN